MFLIFSLIMYIITIDKYLVKKRKVFVIVFNYLACTTPTK
jgi:hypothetical protein